jgi:vacuolar-type H+-ATPase subunit C/Vma6
MMNLTEEDLKSIMESATEQLKSQLKDQLVNKVQWQIDLTAENLIKTHITDWMKENVLPEVTAILRDQKVGLVNAAASAAPKMAEVLSERMVTSFQNNLEGYRGREIFSKMFD